jgi:DNA-binding transcriptional MerR regulator
MTLPRYTLDELCQEVDRCLDHYGLRQGAPDHRVSAVPDGRTVRYYTTLGLVDRPEVVGRQARYGPRHLLQLLAVKALQAKDLSLSEIQRRLLGLAEAELLAIVEAVASSSPARAPRVTPVVWREITIEPGLRLLVEENWRSLEEPALLQARILAALADLGAEPPQ